MWIWKAKMWIPATQRDLQLKMLVDTPSLADSTTPAEGREHEAVCCGAAAGARTKLGQGETTCRLWLVRGTIPKVTS